MKTVFDRKLPAAPRDGNNYAISENACAQPGEDFVGLYPADYKNFPSSVLDRASTLFSVVFTATVNTVRPRIKFHLCDYEPSAYVYFLHLFPRCNIRKFNFFFSWRISVLSDRQHGGTILGESMLTRNSRSPVGKTEIKTKNSGHNLVLLRSQYKTILVSSK